MIRVLQVYPQLNNAGTEMVIMNLYKNIDKNRVQFDFLVEEPGELDHIIRDMGGKIYYIKKANKRNYFKAIIDFFNLHKEYKVVHAHTHRNMGVVLKAAKLAGIRIRIAHSHNSRTDVPKFFTVYKRITSKIVEDNATDFFACSLNAAKWLFPAKYKKARIINNAIDLEGFSYNFEERRKLRNELGIGDNDKVVCHVGRFAKQKNHSFLIEIANYLLSKTDEIKLVLVGDGPLFDQNKGKVKSLGIEDSVIFLGSRVDVNHIMSASDLFLLPSYHEGLGIVLIEAQANGLSCIASEAVPPEADLGLELFTSKLLSDGVVSWANSISIQLNKVTDRNELSNKALNSNYDIKKVAKMVQDFYEKEDVDVK